VTGGLVVSGGTDSIEARTADLRTASHLLLTSAFGIEATADACTWPLAVAAPDFGGPGFEVELRVRAVLGAVQALAADLRRLGRFLDAAADSYGAADDGILAHIWDGVTTVLRTGWHLAILQPEFEYRLLQEGLDPKGAVNSLLTHDPQLADCLVPLTLLVPPLRSLMLDQQAVPAGRAAVRDTGRDTAGAAGEAPRGLTDIVRDLEQRNDGPHGAIDVRILTSADGTRRAIVDITGTKDFFHLVGPDVTDLTTNARALVGRDTAYEDGVFAAMRAAGVGAGDQVMLVGHSQGGMVAVNAAHDAAAHGFTVTHVVTAGSPIGLTAPHLPKHIQLLALENRRDAVPHLDGRDNPDTLNVTTVGFDAGPQSVIDEHGIGTAYLGGAQRVDASDDPAIRAFLDGASGFLGATAVETHTYVVTRRY
jgi:hypothetical protein